MAKISLKLDELIDGDALRREMTALTAATAGDGSGQATRGRVLQLLKGRLADGRKVAETHAEGRWRRFRLRHTAVGHLMDDIIRVLYDFAATHVYRSKNRSAAERMAIVAVGGYGRAMLAPGSDITPVRASLQADALEGAGHRIYSL